MRTKEQIDIEVLEWCFASLGGARPVAVPEECWDSVQATGRLLVYAEPDWRERERLNAPLIDARDFVLPFRQWAVLEAYNLAYPATLCDCPSPTLTCRRSSEDWYVIERWDGGMISDASVEGTGEEMLAIAEAIQNRTRESFRRCAVVVDRDGATFYSPRNSERGGDWFPLAAADTLAARIRKVVSEG